MLPEMLGRDKQSGCLSAWQVSQLALGLADGLAQEHRRGCTDCGVRVQAEEKQRAAAVFERVPSVLEARIGTPPLWRRGGAPNKRVAGLVAGLVVVLLLAVLTPLVWLEWRKPVLEPAVVASVSREGSALMQAVPPAKLGKLRPGDKLRLRVQDSKVHWVRLQAQQGAALWEMYYEGLVPSDGWLPAGFTVTALSRLRLRLLACPQEPAAGDPEVPEGCLVEQFDL